MLGYLSSFEGSLVQQFERLQREMDQLFGTWPGPASIRAVASGSFPAMNVGATPERVDVYVFAPGMNREKLDIQVQKNLLTITGERNAERDRNANYYLSERHEGAFRRVLSLPDDVDPDKVEAVYRDGVLHVSVGRKEQARTRRVQIH